MEKEIPYSDRPITQSQFVTLQTTYKEQIETNTNLFNQQQKLIEQHNRILQKQIEVGTIINKMLEKVNDSHVNIKDTITDKNVDCIKEHGSLKNKIYGVYAGITVVVLSLVTLLHASYQRTDVLKGIEDAVIEIGKKLGVG